MQVSYVNVIFLTSNTNVTGKRRREGRNSNDAEMLMRKRWKSLSLDGNKTLYLTGDE